MKAFVSSPTIFLTVVSVIWAFALFPLSQWVCSNKPFMQKSLFRQRGLMVRDSWAAARAWYLWTCVGSASAGRWCLTLQPGRDDSMWLEWLGRMGQVPVWLYSPTAQWGSAAHDRQQDLCARVVTGLPEGRILTKPWLRTGSGTAWHTLCSGSADDPRCSCKAFPPCCLFLRARIIPCLSFSLSCLPRTLSSRVLELIIYVKMVCKAFLSWSQGLRQQDLFLFVFGRCALCVHPKLVGGWLSSCVIWLLCFQGTLFAEVSWFQYLVALAEKAFRFVLSRNLDSYWNHFINLKKAFYFLSGDFLFCLFVSFILSTFFLWKSSLSLCELLRLSRCSWMLLWAVELLFCRHTSFPAMCKSTRN